MGTRENATRTRSGLSAPPPMSFRIAWAMERAAPLSSMNFPKRVPIRKMR